MKCSCFILKVSENYFINTDIFFKIILLWLNFQYFNSSLVFCDENNTKMFCVFLTLIVPYWSGTHDLISELGILR